MSSQDELFRIRSLLVSVDHALRMAAEAEAAAACVVIEDEGTEPPPELCDVAVEESADEVGPCNLLFSVVFMCKSHQESPDSFTVPPFCLNSDEECLGVALASGRARCAEEVPPSVEECKANPDISPGLMPPECGVLMETCGLAPVQTDDGEECDVMLGTDCNDPNVTACGEDADSDCPVFLGTGDEDDEGPTQRVGKSASDQVRALQHALRRELERLRTD